ncbi:Alpha-1 3/1 6-mannosyltransferase alg-2, variant 2 [Dermatophagoides farinae]|uniref:Alpha-1 3/1 6-mannosyltransferase alg-2, variant 2 n=1 Tax=Dermatophagoides farinae TaxID=6954 RepID=A0A922HTW1_DERFA|nr:programmed cell death protein 6-like protein [Dermatophagoides farinae]KAH9507136.1 Alpha-1 3/1 6-mannosyltransferase alg-2, variant 2 [Dermatophagoides farinae]
MTNTAANAHQMPNQEWLRSVFDKVDKDRSGQISANELQGALSNGTWKPFNPETVRLMIAMFDKDKTGSINFEEFSHLWRYVTDWLNCFRSFDRDNSGNIDPSELRQALTTFGYRFTDSFLQILMKRYDREGKGHVTFDDFIQLCVQLQSLTNAFRQFDTDMDGWIKISYEQFLTMVLNIALN